MRTKLFVLPLLVALLTSLIAPTLVQGAVASQTVVGQIGGVTNSVVLSGGQLYFNVGPRVVRTTVPALTPGSPTLPGTYGGILPGIPLDLKVANGFVYVAMGRDGVAVVDGTTLQVLGVQILPSTGYAAAVAVGPQRLYVAAGNAGIVSYNLGSDNKTLTYSATDPFFASPVRNVTDVETIHSGAADLLYASANNFTTVPADKGGVMKFDVTSSPDPGAPANSVQVDANALALGTSTVYAASDDTFYVLSASTLASSGSAALASPAVQLALRPSGNWVYVTSAFGIDAVNVTDPTAPAVATLSALVTGGFARGLATGEFVSSTSTMLYVADFNAGLTIATSLLSAPETLAVTSESYVMPKPAIASVVAGAYNQGLPFSNSATLWTVNSTNPAMLAIAGGGITPAAPIRSLTTYNNLLLASVDTEGLSRYQVNPGAEPSGVATFSTGGTAYAAAVAWPNAAVADGANGLSVVNINGTMSLVGHVAVPDLDFSSYELVDVKGSLAFVYDNDGTGHVRIYDLTTPTSPLVRGVLTQTGVLDLKVSGNFLFLACGTDGVKVANISNPDAPAFVGGADYPTPLGSAQALALYNSNLLIAQRGAGVEMVAIAPAGTLTNVTRFDTSGNAIQLALVPGNYLYVADQNGGLVAIQSSLLGVNWIYLPLVTRN